MAGPGGWVREGEAPAEPCILGEMRERLGGSLALPTRDGSRQRETALGRGWYSGRTNRTLARPG